MYNFLLRKLSIERNEAGLSLSMFVTAGLLGVFLSTYDIGVHAVFMNQFDTDPHGSRHFLSLAFIISGLLGIILLNLYSQFFKRVSIKTFNFLNLFLLISAALSYFFLTVFQPNIADGFFINLFQKVFPKRAYATADVNAFINLVFLFPINVLAILNFNRFNRNVFYPEQRRRILPVIEIGMLLGIICGSYSIIGILFITNEFNALLPIITLSAAGLLFIWQLPQNIVHHQGEAYQHKKQHFVPVKSSFFLMFTSRYTYYLFLFALLSAIIGFIIHFSFMIWARVSFPHIIGMSKFYGLFYGTLYIFIILAERLLVRRILYSYDSPYSLILLPLAMCLVLIIIIIINILMGSTTALATRFTFLFLLILIIKIVYETGKYTIQVPSLRTLYKTLDIRFSQVIFARIEGALIMFGLFIAGGVIAILTYFHLYSFVALLILTLLVTPLWFYFGAKLIKTYKAALQETYKKLRISRHIDQHIDSYNEKIRKILVGDKPVKVINALNLSAQIEPLAYETSLRRMLANPNPEIQHYILNCIEKEGLLYLLPDLKSIQAASSEVGILAASIISKFEKRLSQINEGNNLQELIASRKVHDRVFAAEIIGNRKDTTYTAALINLSREFEPDVKIAAVKAIARMSNSEHSYILIEFLSSPQFRAYAFEALVQIGEPSLEYLERLFLDSGTDDKILARSVRIYGKIGTEKAIELLLNKLENQNQRITEQTLLALREANFQANSQNINRILNLIVRTIGVLGWNFLVYTSLPKHKNYFTLKMAFAAEIDDNYTRLFDLLALAYNSRTVREIRDLIVQGSKADVSHAIEMLDHFVYDEIKPVLFPVIENISNEDRVKKLQYYFPIETMTTVEIISSILTRDYNILSIYPRVCAMQLALEMPTIEVNQELIANIFHPNQLLREMAATVVYHRNPQTLFSVVERLDIPSQHEVKELVSILEKKHRLLIIEKFNILLNTSRISELSEEIIIELAHALEERNFTAGQNFELKTHISTFSLFIILKGDVKFNDVIISPKTDSNYEIFYSKILLNEGIHTLHFDTDTSLLRIEHETVESLLFDHTEMASCLLSCVEQFKLAG